MTDMTHHIIVMIVPLVISNSIHMVVVKRNLFPSTSQPLWNWGFGKNKTWRGLVFVPVANAIVLMLISLLSPIEISAPAFLGFILGLAYMFAELPNSFVKRRLGLAPGENHGRYRVAFSILDKLDSATGVIVVYTLTGHATWQEALWLLLFAFAAHVMVSALLVTLKIKSSF
jgi:hypothetical protein